MMLILLILSCLMSQPAPTVTVYDFRKGVPADAWQIQDDRVMGGISRGRLEMTEEGHARFHGHVTTESNGGFSSIQHNLESEVDISQADRFVLRLKGDGKTYTFRVKTDHGNRYSHQASFPTSGEWQTVEIPFDSMEARYRGRSVDVPNFSGGTIVKLQFLIGNKKEQDFEVLIDRIEAR